MNALTIIVLVLLSPVLGDQNLAAPRTAGAEPVFAAVDSISEELFEAWFRETYLPDLDNVDLLMRHRFVTYDADDFRRQLKESLLASERFQRDSRGSLDTTQVFSPDGTDIDFNLFENATFRVAIVRLRVGRHSGMTMVEGVLIGEGFKGRERVYFELSSDGSLKGAIITSVRYFQIRNASAIGVATILEFDHDGKLRLFRVD